MSHAAQWPELTIADWQDSRDTVHRWTQVVGKIRTTQMPWINHSWHVTLYVTPRGLTTLSMPHDEKTFQIDFDFFEHCLRIQSNHGREKIIELSAMSVAEFHDRLMKTLQSMGLAVHIHGRPNEVEDDTPFQKDQEHRAYDSASLERFQRALVQVDRVMTAFRSRFIGKCSPVHFFWGSFDMAVTRFSGRRAPEHPGGFPNMPDWITREAYSHEVSSCGFWPGGDGQEALFYSYAYPTPEGYSDAEVLPEAAHFSRNLGEFVLPYDVIQRSHSPDTDLLAFFQSTYNAAADLANWDRDAPEWEGPRHSVE